MHDSRKLSDDRRRSEACAFWILIDPAPRGTWRSDSASLGRSLPLGIRRHNSHRGHWPRLSDNKSLPRERSQCRPDPTRGRDEGGLVPPARCASPVLRPTKYGRNTPRSVHLSTTSLIGHNAEALLATFATVRASRVLLHCVAWLA